MTDFEHALGIVWGEIRMADGIAPSDVFADGVSHEGSRAVVSANTPGSSFPGLPAAALELAHAEVGSPAFSMWGCPDGTPYLHHIAYWVDDFGAESRHLADCGWRRELYLPAEAKARLAYFRSPLGFRVSLISSNLQEATADRIAAGGRVPFAWPKGSPH